MPAPVATTYICPGADVLNTYIAAAALSSGFDHVGVIAVEKHPTGKEKRAHISTCFFYSNIKHDNVVNVTSFTVSLEHELK